jgi:tRNA threonylcarbamoyl adenosine modification protein (Sua5/YciO/YrdC/YwlC family)
VEIRDVRSPRARGPAIKEAARAIGRGELVVLPTDTVYGIAADPANPAAVSRLLAAKGRSRRKPPPVLIPDAQLLDSLAASLTPAARALARSFWPGPLTLVVVAAPGLDWDLGALGGTIALRVPDGDVARDLLAETGPLATSSANRTRLPDARTAAQAAAQLGETVAIVLDAGPSGAAPASTVVDVTGPHPRLLRAGGIHSAALRAAAGCRVEDPA